MQYYRIISLDNNNSVKFTSSRGDNSTTNDSMVMKIAHAQIHMYKNIMYKCQSSTCKTVGEKLRTKLCPRTDGRTDSHGDSGIPPPLRWGGGGKKKKKRKKKSSALKFFSENLPEREVFRENVSRLHENVHLSRPTTPQPCGTKIKEPDAYPDLDSKFHNNKSS